MQGPTAIIVVLFALDKNAPLLGSVINKHEGGISKVAIQAFGNGINRKS